MNRQYKFYTTIKSIPILGIAARQYHTASEFNQQGQLKLNVLSLFYLVEANLNGFGYLRCSVSKRLEQAI